MLASARGRLCPPVSRRGGVLHSNIWASGPPITEEKATAFVNQENLYMDSAIGKMTSYRLDPDAPCVPPRTFSCWEMVRSRPRLLDF